MAEYNKNKGKTSKKNRADKNLYIQEENTSIKWFSMIKYTLIIGLACILAGVVALKLYLSSLPPINNLEQFKPNIVTKFYSADERIIKTFTSYTYEKIELQDIPNTIKLALIATEDKNFYHHNGYDLVGLARSTVMNVLAGRVVQGASTLTQQLARVLFLSNERTFDRKLKELFISARIEKTLSKDKILEMYMNNVYLGSGAYGVEAAAHIYFGKHLKECSLAELALIAGLPQAPSVYSPFNNPLLAAQRRNQVLLRMYKMRNITKKEYNDAINEKLTLATPPKHSTTNVAPYFSDYVMKELGEIGFDEDEIINGGYKVVTTLDYDTQMATNKAITKNLINWGLRGDNNQAAVFSFSPVDGKILAYSGGKDYSTSQYDRITLAIRPPGSAFKPIVYSAAIEKGIDPNDMIEDMPVVIGDWSPHNYGNKYRGEIPVYSALMVSSNVGAARMIKAVGINSVLQLARVLGIETPIEYDYTIALGSNGVKLFEFTRAYSALANGGYVVQPYAVESVETSRGKVIYRAQKAKSSRHLSLKTVATMTAMLKNVITASTGRAANIGKPAAGKTGTTDDNKDAYFVGYTPNVVTGVWVGNDDNIAMNKAVQGGTVPALIWKDVMTVATEPYGNAEFNYPIVELMPFDVNEFAVIITDEDLEQEGYLEEVVGQMQEAKEKKEREKEMEKIKEEFGDFQSPTDIIKNFNRKKIERAKQLEDEKNNLINEKKSAEEQIKTKPLNETPAPINGLPSEKQAPTPTPVPTSTTKPSDVMLPMAIPN
ncbi:MAG: PBP1A family penicillin-binding protein [Candidatus Gastranaerophilales bacterium]